MQSRCRTPLWLSTLVGSDAFELLGGEARRALKDDDVFETQKCLAAVNEVNKTGSYSEESITPVCEKHMAWRKCDFFAEALSLASSHQDFNKTHFCQNMEEAHFCSGSMDNLLSSIPVSDLAFGECVRAEPKRSDEYCKKFQKMLAYAVQEEYLDTIRACYMIESYGNVTSEKKEEEATPPATTAQPQGRIIVSSSKELDHAGKGKANPGNSPPQVAGFGKEGIVVKPEPLTDIGDGKGNMKGKTAPGPAPSQAKSPAASEAQTQGNIIVEPVPAKEAGAKEALVVRRSAVPTKARVTPSPTKKAAQPSKRGAVASKSNVTVHSHIASLVAHPSKVTAAPKEKEKLKKDAKDGYGGFLSSFVSQ